MRNILPLATFGCALTALIGIVVGGVIMIGYGVSGFFDKNASPDTPKAIQAQPVVVPAAPKETRTLLEARSSFKTVLIANNFERGADAPPPPAEAKIVRYRAGELVAYLSKPRGEERRPAVVFVHGGFGGIDRKTWDQAKLFHDAGCVVMCPAFREENDNAGLFEMFYGEVDDLLAAVDFVGKQPSVDANRIYVVGAGTGGTLALLAATTGTDKVRAFFAIGGHTDIDVQLRETNIKEFDGSPPFDPNRKQETYLRSPTNFVKSIQRPAFYFQAQVVADEAREAKEMQRRAFEVSAPFHAYIVPKANAFNFLPPTLGVISRKIERDTGVIQDIHFDFEEVVRPFQK